MSDSEQEEDPLDEPEDPASPEGQRWHHPAAVEMRERVAFTKKLLLAQIARGDYCKSDVKRALMQRYNVVARTCEEYLKRARAAIIADQGGTPEEVRSDSVGFWRAIVANGAYELRDRMRARENLDDILNVKAQKKVEHTGSVGVAVNANVVAADAIRQFMFEHPEYDDDDQPAGESPPAELSAADPQSVPS